ncbi:hypothetical protein [Marinobacter sp.]|uniref:hypothetical protein n=1 Tax=Marinobacter sp. TaxID=50741 RepID=UPI0034A21D62
MEATRIKGLTIALLGVLFITADALLVKITSVEPVVFLFWRGLLLAFSFFVISWLIYRQGRRQLINQNSAREDTHRLTSRNRSNDHATSTDRPENQANSLPLY